MRVHIASDHAGFEVKHRLVEHLRAGGCEVVDHGPFVLDPLDDYPVFCLRAAEAVASDPGSLGVVLGGSGNGEQISANKVDGIRAALGWSELTARLAREHNDANVLGLGARMHDLDEAVAIVDAFLATPFSSEERHRRRLEMISRYEADGELPPLPRR
jgi:ribose 5-phosphate isomerase B